MNKQRHKSQLSVFKNNHNEVYFNNNTSFLDVNNDSMMKEKSARGDTSRLNISNLKTLYTNNAS